MSGADVKADVWPPLPFAETTAWSASHVGRRLALEAAERETVLACFHCRADVVLNGRGVACAFPCCGADACERARKRRYQAEYRARKRNKKEK